MRNTIKKLLPFVCASVLLFACACNGGNTENGSSTGNSGEVSDSVNENESTSESGSSENEETPPSSDSSEDGENGGASDSSDNGDSSSGDGDDSSNDDSSDNNDSTSDDSSGGEDDDSSENPPQHEHVAQADDGNCTTPVKCECGETIIEAKTHAYDHDCDLSCNYEGCEYERTFRGHSDSDKDNRCDDCNAEIPANGGGFELPEDKFE